MALTIEDPDSVPARVVIDQFRDTLARNDLDGQPVNIKDSLATVFAQLATTVDELHRNAQRQALDAIARGDLDEAKNILAAATEARP
jgi:hypothetical protein